MLGTSHVAVVTLVYLQHWDPYRHSRNGWYIVSTIAANEGFDNCTRQGRYVSSSSLLDLAKWISTKVDLLLLCSSRSLFRKKMYYTLRTSTTNIWILNLHPFCHTVNDSHLSPFKKVMMREKRSKLYIYIYIHIFFKSDSRKAKLRAVVAAAAVAAAKRCSAKKCGCVVRQRHIFLRDDHDWSYIPDRKLRYGGSSHFSNPPSNYLKALGASLKDIR